jgi:ABC-type branched-subunit amino acid transport system ATPase component
MSDALSVNDAMKTTSGAARLELTDVMVTFGGVRAVDGVSLTVEPGSLVGLIGPNGSGKTTLLDTISGQLRPTSGRIKLDGVDLVDHLPEDRAALGIVRSFQDCRLYPELTVEDTLLVAQDATRPVGLVATSLQLPRARRTERAKRQRVNELIASLGLQGFRNHPVSHLSTGTRRVVDLAAIVGASPRLLLLDEPTAGIAQREAEAFGPLLRRLHGATGSTIVIVEHDVPLVMSICDQVVVLAEGRVVTMGGPAQVAADPAATEVYLGASEEALARSGPWATTTPAATPTTTTTTTTTTTPTTKEEP